MLQGPSWERRATNRRRHLNGSPSAALLYLPAPRNQMRWMLPRASSEDAELAKGFPPGLKDQVTLDTTKFHYNVDQRDCENTWRSAPPSADRGVRVSGKCGARTLIPMLAIPVSHGRGVSPPLLVLGVSIKPADPLRHDSGDRAGC